MLSFWQQLDEKLVKTSILSDNAVVLQAVNLPWLRREVSGHESRQRMRREGRLETQHCSAVMSGEVYRRVWFGQRLRLAMPDGHRARCIQGRSPTLAKHAGRKPRIRPNAPVACGLEENRMFDCVGESWPGHPECANLTFLAFWWHTCTHVHNGDHKLFDEK